MPTMYFLMAKENFMYLNSKYAPGETFKTHTGRVKRFKTLESARKFKIREFGEAHVYWIPTRLPDAWNLSPRARTRPWSQLIQAGDDR